MLRLLVASWAGNTSAAQNEQPMNDMNLQYWYIMFYNNLLTFAIGLQMNLPIVYTITMVESATWEMIYFNIFYHI